MAAGKGIYNARWEKSFDRILTPLEEFIHRQTTSGVLLMICAVVALIIANGPLHEQYEHFLHTEIGFSIGDFVFSLSIHHWINELLMAAFFFIMGLELLLGPRVPKNLITFLIALAIVDDLGAVAVIALFYTESIDLFALACAGGCTVLLVFLNLGGIRRPLPYAAVGALL